LRISRSASTLTNGNLVGLRRRTCRRRRRRLTEGSSEPRVAVLYLYLPCSMSAALKAGHLGEPVRWYSSSPARFHPAIVMVPSAGLQGLPGPDDASVAQRP
jgi:hypothetical protein